MRKLSKEHLSAFAGIEYSKEIQIIPEGQSGEFRVEDDFDYDREIFFQRLFKNGIEISNNDPVNIWIHKRFISAAHGDVLIFGLGLGTSLHEILKNDDVKSVTIIELEQDIINLVSPHFEDNRVKIVCADMNGYIPERIYDVIYFAIWGSKEMVDQNEIKRLHSQFKEYCDKSMAVFEVVKGGRRPGAGRKHGSTGGYKDGSEKRTVQKGIRFTQGEYDLIDRAADAIGKPAAYLMQMASVKEAKNILTAKGYGSKS
jgi:hypothetical protein